MQYQQFIENKIITTPDSGFSVDESVLHKSNLPHQRDIIKWALRGGCRALFASFGLGKTQIQLEMARLTIEQFGGAALIVMPLGVKGEFKKDAKRLEMKIDYVRNMEEVNACKTPFMITNYERVRDGDIDPSYFIFASLDEASVLRSYGSKTYQEFLVKFQSVPYRYVCTATPSPNRYKELIHYAGFLGIMDTGQALTRFFKRDSTKANNLTIYSHKEEEFWLWMSTWALFITKPSDLGYSDEGYDLPPINVIWHRLNIMQDEPNKDRDGQLKMIRDIAFDLKSSAKEKRETIIERIAEADAIISQAGDDRHWVIWHHLESEREAVEMNIADVISVYGSQSEEDKERLLMDFADGKFRILATKPIIAGQGCNFQKHCHSAIFLGIDYKFNDFIQAIHRLQRFQQPHPVDIHIIYTDSEDHIRKEFEAKWKRHNELVENMTNLIREYGLSNSGAIEKLKRSISVKRQEVKGKHFTAINNDNVTEIKTMADNSVGLIHTSIPFSNHYEYTPSYLDFGHTNNDEHFFAQMDFLTKEELRVLQPGRLNVVHVKDRILFGNVTGSGMPTVNPFHAKTIFHYTKHGFAYMGMITIETDVVRENNQTYRLGWTEQCKDGSKMGVGSPEYLLIFRKLPTDTSNAYADVPVFKTKEDYTRGRWQIDARAKWNSSGNRLLTPEELKRYPVDIIADQFSREMREMIYDYHKHVEIADELDNTGKLPATFEMLRVPERTDGVWGDVVRMRTLNSSQNRNNQEAHICPLQLDIVERVINRYSNPGDVVLDPFGGLMTVPYMAVKMGRYGVGIELNPGYFKDGVGYLKEAEHKKTIPTLFDTL